MSVLPRVEEFERLVEAILVLADLPQGGHDNQEESGVTLDCLNRVPLGALKFTDLTIVDGLDYHSGRERGRWTAQDARRN